MSQRITADERIASYKAEHPGYSPDPAEVVRWRRADQKAAARYKEKLARTGSVLDVRKRVRDPWNPFSLNIARAKVLIERGESDRRVSLTTGLDRKTVARVRHGTYDAHIPAPFLEQCRASEPAKLTMVAAQIVDSILENPGVIEGATLQQRMAAVDIAVKNRELLEGRPTSRIDHLTNLPDEALQREMIETYRQLGARLKARGHDELDAAFENAEVVQATTLPTGLEIEAPEGFDEAGEDESLASGW